MPVLVPPLMWMIYGIVNEQNINADILSAGQDNQDAIIKMRYMENQQEIHENIVKGLQEKYNLASDAISIDYVGPTMGRTLIQNAVMSVLIAGALMLVYIWIRFELVSGVAAVIVASWFIIAVTAITGIQLIALYCSCSYHSWLFYKRYHCYFDRVRENLKRMGRKSPMSEIVNESIRQSITRTLTPPLLPYLL